MFITTIFQTYDTDCGLFHKGYHIHKYTEQMVSKIFRSVTQPKVTFRHIHWVNQDWEDNELYNITDIPHL